MLLKPLLRAPWGYLVLAVAGMVSGYLLRVYLIEPQEVGAICTAEQVPLWCSIRHGIIMGMIHGPWRWSSVVLVFCSLFLSRSLAPLFLILGMFSGGVSLFMFSTNYGALAVVTGLLRALALGQPSRELPPQGA